MWDWGDISERGRWNERDERSDNKSGFKPAPVFASLFEIENKGNC